jgi:hypothetical protein
MSLDPAVPDASNKQLSLPTGISCVRLRRNQGSQSALEVINDSDVYGVMGETETCLHLFDIPQYRASREMRRLGGPHARFRKSWFEAAPGAGPGVAPEAGPEAGPEAAPEAGPEAGATDGGSAGDRGEAGGGEGPRGSAEAGAKDDKNALQKRPARLKYTLRKSSLPSEARIWAAHGVDRYTGRPREHYASLKTPVHRDHVLEVQMLDTVLETAFPRVGELDAGGVEVARQVLCPFLNGGGEFHTELLNLNNTEDILNQYWKGGSVRLWRKHFHETGGDVQAMRQRLGGDASLAGLMRASMRVDSDGQAVQALAADRWKGRGARAQASYRPAWARAVDSAMGGAGRALLERLREHDGQTPFLRVADGLEDVLCKMELKGFAR